MASYCLDTSTFINGWVKYYRRDVFPCVWNALDELISLGKVVSCLEVYKELEKKEDSLLDWARRRKKIFEHPTADVIAELTNVMASHPNFAAQGGSTNAADPWVIAHAKLGGHVIVTDEQPALTKPTKPPKIPNVCEALGISWMKPIDLFSDNGYQFDYEFV